MATITKPADLRLASLDMSGGGEVSRRTIPKSKMSVFGVRNPLMFKGRFWCSVCNPVLLPIWAFLTLFSKCFGTSVHCLSRRLDLGQICRVGPGCSFVIPLIHRPWATKRSTPPLLWTSD